MPAGAFGRGVPAPEIVSYRSGYESADDRAFVVLQRDTGSRIHRYGQRFEAIGTGGTRTDLGGGCGVPVGPLSTVDAIAIGNPDLALLLPNGDPSAAAVARNVGLPGAPIGCGPCRITPRMMTVTPRRSANGSASLQVPVPCDLGLLGQSLEWQRVLIGTASQACALAPGVTFSNRLLTTFGL